MSLVRNNQISAPTVPMTDKTTTLKEIASLGADTELGYVSYAFLESAEMPRNGEKLYLQQSRGSLPSLSDQRWLEVVLSLYGLKDSPKRWVLKFTFEQLGWKLSALEKCVFLSYVGIGWSVVCTCGQRGDRWGWCCISEVNWSAASTAPSSKVEEKLWRILWEHDFIRRKFQRYLSDLEYIRTANSETDRPSETRGKGNGDGGEILTITWRCSIMVDQRKSS